MLHLKRNKCSRLIKYPRKHCRIFKPREKCTDASFVCYPVEFLYAKIRKMALNQAAKELLSVMKNEDYEKLVDLASKNKSKKIPYTFKDAIKNLSGSEIDKMWSMLNKMVEKKAEVLLDGNKDTSNTSLDNKTCTELNQVLHAAIDLASVVFEESMPASQDLLQMVVFLNGILFEIPSSIENLRNSIAHLCEKMYHLNYVVNLNQYLIHNIVIYLLKRTLNRKAIKTDVKRIYAMRSAIPKILEMSEINPKLVWELLKKCATSPLYLSMLEGQKIIALALSTDVKYVATMHEAIKQKLLSGSVEQGVTYGKIYYEAYTHSVKTNNETLKNELEMICLQDIILTAIQSRDKKIVLVLQKMLGQFHYQKKEVYISKMLYFLYQPILWR
ncbi:Condensin-2 complex subunit G2, partial [Stegodyphus mimosarum]